LNQIYASSSPSTCQALLLLSYREIGIGAMAQAWLYVGMAVRMAQDLGLNRAMDRLQRGGTTLFSPQEQQVRRRIWYACVIMDKYVSTYIGRPLSIFERDFDTPLPEMDELEENELWEDHPSSPEGQHHDPDLHNNKLYVPVPSRPVATFVASATLSSIVSQIVHSLYSIRPGHTASRHADAQLLEKKLDKWYLDLPDYLHYDPVVRRTPVPPPHMLTFLMNYWTTVMLLHRPFIHTKSGQSESPEASPRGASSKAQDMCMAAAAHTSSLITVYMENFCVKRSQAFLSYYIFSAGIMHVASLSTRHDVQASIGLSRCMAALKRMEVIWPSAGRAWELLHGSKVQTLESDVARLEYPADSRRKRAARDVLEDRTETAFSMPGRQPIPQPVANATPGPTYGAEVPVPQPYYQQYDTRWMNNQQQFHPHPIQPNPAGVYPGRVEPNLVSPVEPFPSVPGPGGGRFGAYNWGEYQETFGEPAALQASLYDHPLNAIPRQQPSAHYPDYSSGQFMGMRPRHP